MSASPLTATTPTLEVDGLSVSYPTPTGRLHAVRDVSFSIAAGQTFGLIGESGSGKSTVAYSIMRYLPQGRVDAGSVQFKGRELLHMSAAELNRLRGSAMAMVYQEPQSALNPSLRVGDQVAETIRLHHRISPSQARERVVEAFEQVNLPNPGALFDRYPHQLSGGQQQRVVIAMALVANPDLLVMDEPTTGLDVTTEARILDLIAELKGRLGAAILYISHSLGVIARVCDRVGVMYAGRIVERGSVSEIFRAPRHPYTVGLLECLPRLGVDREGSRLKAIPGGLPDLTLVPAGCIFAPRCDYARSECGQTEPRLEAVEQTDHFSRCHFWREVRPPQLIPITGAEAAAAPVASTAEPLLSVADLKKYYQDSGGLFSIGRGAAVRAVDGVSLSLQPGETLAVVGESGCGKTTLARCVVGLLAPSEGALRFRGSDIGALARQRDREQRQQVQMVFQNPEATLNPRHTIGESVGRPLRLFTRLHGEELRSRVIELLRAVRLDERFVDRLPRQLSGGEKQRVSIARAFAADPKLIVCDEPVSALDVSVQAAVLNLLADLQRDRDTAYLFISHDLSVVRYISDRVVIVYLGKVMEAGTAEQVFSAPFHPYTEALLSAVPIPDPEVFQEQIRLVGPVPNPANPPSGCVFQTRCPRKLGPICEQQSPPLHQANVGHTIACHIPLEELSRLEPIKRLTVA